MSDPGLWRGVEPFSYDDADDTGSMFIQLNKLKTFSTLDGSQRARIVQSIQQILPAGDGLLEAAMAQGLIDTVTSENGVSCIDPDSLIFRVRFTNPNCTDEAEFSKRENVARQQPIRRYISKGAMTDSWLRAILHDTKQREEFLQQVTTEYQYVPCARCKDDKKKCIPLMSYAGAETCVYCITDGRGQACRFDRTRRNWRPVSPLGPLQLDSPYQFKIGGKLDDTDEYKAAPAELDAPEQVERSPASNLPAEARVTRSQSSQSPTKRNKLRDNALKMPSILVKIPTRDGGRRSATTMLDQIIIDGQFMEGDDSAVGRVDGVDADQGDGNTLEPITTITTMPPPTSFNDPYAHLNPQPANSPAPAAPTPVAPGNSQSLQSIEERRHQLFIDFHNRRGISESPVLRRTSLSAIRRLSQPLGYRRVKHVKWRR